ncbi:MAG: hypothetical protein FJ087_21465 [Deltaproteobacteria bacterium]|nr:hypothetical protein [Deltaproteobacteria bacterium]
MRAAARIVVAGLLVACSTSSPGPSSDVAPDAAPDAADAAEVAADAPGDTDPGPQCDWPIKVPEDAPDPGRTKFAMTMFHFNVQYVAGGLSYTDGDGVEHPLFPEAAGWDEKRVEDWIVTETFAPVVDFYLAHPNWQADIEMGSYLLEILAERHPAVLDKLRTVTQRGQVELISFHYSAQLFLAFPREDAKRSIDLTKELFRKHCLPLGGAVFDQEGQAGEGRQDLLVKEGYTVGVYPVNLFRHQHGELPRWPYYKSRGGDLIVGPGGVDPASGIEVEWLFFDDGELLAAEGKADPYVAPNAKFSQADMDAFAREIEAKEAAGFRIAHVSDYVRHLKARGVEQREPPPLLDGTWQPRSTRAILRWLGGRGLLFGATERDNDVRTGNSRAHGELVLGGALLGHAKAGGLDVAAADGLLAEGWRHLFFAEVSDATGINPWEGEVRYGLRHNDAALARAGEAIGKLKAALGTPWVAIDSGSGKVTPLADRPIPEPPAKLADPPFVPTVTAPTRQVSIEWYEDGLAGAALEIGLSAGVPGFEGDPAASLIEVAFPRSMDRIRYSPGLLDDEVVDYGFDEFAWPDGELFLPLGNGLVALGEGLWLVKDCRTVHLAARLAPDDPHVRFRDETAAADRPVTYRFGVVKGSAAEALKVANAWNVKPAGIR